MASMMGGDFVEAYVLKNTYKEKVRRMEAKSKNGGAGSGAWADLLRHCSGEKKAAASSRGGGVFGLRKKKVHPKAAASSESSGASS
ncbi:uncharacterized protein LOC133917929 [Phragmites australis]|uniref:uncharacterized protein LOC133917929 n=1 Tax=Phragmites australis TaxID=29695 RepID=UPI002D773060|nr:uncharacterized protein LOC133917929 [Phragmites australis]